MKKSKVLIPAMALLLFSTAASITGTVAWFSSTRIFDTDIGNFTVAEIDGNLECEMGAGVGTTLNSGNNSISVDADARLIDASLDATNSALGTGKTVDVYRRVRTSGYYDYKVATEADLDGLLDSAVENDIAYVVADSDHDNGPAYYKAVNDSGMSWVYQSGATYGEAYHLYTEGTHENPGDWLYRVSGPTGSVKKYYLAVSWTMKFTYEFKSESTSLRLFLDSKESTLADDRSNAGSGATQTYHGFRIAFITESGTKVWGKRDPSTLGVGEKNTYVAGSAYKDIDEYASLKYFYPNSTFNAVGVKDDDESTQGVAEHIATIPYEGNTNGVNSVTIKCVAWFEGTDPAIVSRSTNYFNTLSASMHIFGRSSQHADN